MKTVWLNQKSCYCINWDMISHWLPSEQVQVLSDGSSTARVVYPLWPNWMTDLFNWIQPDALTFTLPHKLASFVEYVKFMEDSSSIVYEKTPGKNCTGPAASKKPKTYRRTHLILVTHSLIQIQDFKKQEQTKKEFLSQTCCCFECYKKQI